MSCEILSPVSTHTDRYDVPADVKAKRIDILRQEVLMIKFKETIRERNNLPGFYLCVTSTPNMHQKQKSKGTVP